MDSESIKVITDIVLAFVAVSLPPLVGVLVLWIKSKLNLNQQAKIKWAVDAAVNAAELLKAQNGWTGETAKEWVVTEITNQFPSVDPDLLNMIIESCVAQLKVNGAELANTKSGVKLASVAKASELVKAPVAKAKA